MSDENVSSSITREARRDDRPSAALAKLSGLRTEDPGQQTRLSMFMLGAGIACLIAAFSLLPGPPTALQVFVALGVGLTLVALYLAFTVRADSGAVQLERVGARLERRLERLQDTKWELSENEARYRALLDAQAEAILRRDEDGRLTFVNRAFLEMFGLVQDAALGRPFTPKLCEPSEARPLAVADGVRRQRFVQHVLTAAGPRWIEWEEQLVAGPGGDGLEVQSLGRDVTEQHRAKTQLAEACDQAEAANRAKSRFLAAMSHEIRTPMNGILGMASLLLDTPQTPEQQTYACAIDQSARTLLALIDEILDFSKIEAGKLELASAPFALDACVQGAVELLAPRAHEKGLELAWSVSPDLPRLVLGDEARVRQILLNLMSNAVKFTDVGGLSVRVGLAEEEVESGIAIEMTIEDTGIGLSDDDMGRLFTEFEQAEAAIRRRDGGTGLGLAISMQLARAMGGKIGVASTPGKGSTFTAVLRLQEAVPVAVAEPEAGVAMPGVVEGARVLLAFDRVLERRALHEGIAAAGVSVSACDFNSAEDVLAQAAREGAPFDRLVVDGDVGPAAAGKLLARARALNGRSVRGIVLVNVLARSGLAEFRAAGVDAYLVRPVRPTSMMTQLQLQNTLTAAAPAGSGGERGASETGFTARKHRVLIAEDNEINALLAKRMIEKCGHAHVVVANGADAVACVQRAIDGVDERIDLVLMDVFMPVLDGLEAARAIKALCAASPEAITAPPIIALTANAFAEDRQRCLAAGMDDYLAKPFDKDGLERVLRRWLGALPGDDADAA